MIEQVKKIFFSIIIPVKQYNNYVLENLEILKEFKVDFFEVILVPDEIEPCKEKYLLENFEFLGIIQSGAKSPAIKRDIASRSAKGNYLCFLDDDSFPSSDYFDVLLLIVQRKSVPKVFGGPALTPPNNNNFQKMSGGFYELQYLSSSRERYIPIQLRNNYVNDWPSVNLIVERDLFTRLGGFGQEFWPGEDTAFCNKVIENNFKIEYFKNLIVFHHRRKSFRDHLKQLGAYGLHRGNFARNFRGNSFELKYFLPTVFFLHTLTMLPIFFFNVNLNAVSLIILFPYFLYLILLLISLTLIRRKYSFFVLFGIFLLTPISHFFYGFKFLEGFLISSPIKSKLR